MPKKVTDKSVDTAQIKKASMALDDLVWSLQSLDVEKLQVAAETLRKNLQMETSNSLISENYRSGNQNKDFLIGVLPRLFQDKELFPQNEDITEFADAALGLETKRAQKRSRYEIIGKLVVEISNLNDQSFGLLANALENLIDDNDQLALVVKKKKTGEFSWNETIQNLLKD
jgi:hypothetical protein